MSIFKITRLSIWALLLAICIVIGSVYLTVQQELLSSDGLKNSTAQSNVPNTVRTDILAPKVYAAVQQSDIASSIDRQSVDRIIEQVASDQVLTQKMSPAFTSLEEWINGNRTTIEFSIETSDLVDSIASKLTDAAVATYASLPACTVRSAQLDVQNGTCRSNLVTEAMFRTSAERNITQAIESADTTITQDSIPYFSSITTSGANIPRYLNIFYAVTLVALAVLALGTLWLLIKHRFTGVTVIGAGILIAAFSLLIVTIVSPRLGNYAPESLPRPLVTSVVQGINKALLQKSAYLAVAGSAAVIIGSAITIILSRRRARRSTMQFSKK